MHDDVLSRVEGLVRDQKPSGDILSPAEARGALLHGGSPYDWKPSAETLASYQADLLSIPEDVSGCPSLSSVLPEKDLIFLEENSELMLKEQDDVPGTLVEPFWDPKLKFNLKAYGDLVRRLHNIGMFNYTRHPKCMVGVFFVWKSNRTKLRLITDARRSNQLFRDAPGVGLMTGEGFGRIEVELDDSVACDTSAMNALEFYVGLSDVKDCFHRLRVPMWLSRYFCWIPVTAKTVGLQGTVIDGHLLEPLDAIYPCAGSLCQGFTWSLYFAQHANEEQCKRVDPLCDSRLVFDRGGPIVFHVNKDVASDPHYYVYVDNLGVLYVSQEMVEECMVGLKKCFDSQGLTLHAAEVSSGEVETLGCLVEGRRMRSRINPKRLWKVHHAIQGLLRRGRCVGRTVEIIVGHLTFCGLMNRMSLSCFHSVYAFIRKNYTTVARLWPSVVSELRCFSGLLFMMVQDWVRPWNSLVSSSDSSLGGFGVCHAWWPRDEVSKCGRRLERSRFRRSSGHSARESALQAAGFELHAGLWTKSNVEASKRLASAGWEVDEDFEEVPSAGLKRELWIPKIWGKWHFGENILLLEAKAVLKGIKRILLTRFGHSMRQLVLCDNMSVVLSIERCRSKNFRLLCIIRKICAFCLARNVHLAIRWIPSELNVSGEPSRLDGPEESKLLVDLIDDVWSGEKFASQGCHAPQKAQLSCAAAHTNSSSRKIPRAWRCMRGWRKLCPARSRLAYPLPVWMAVSWQISVQGHLQKAAFNLIQLCTYHRPGALLKLKKMGLVRPTRGVTSHWSVVTSLSETSDVSKTGTKDDSILLDSPWILFMTPILEELSKKKPMGVQLCRLPLSLSCLLHQAEAEPCPVPGKTFRAKHRPVKVLENAGGGEETRRLVEPKQCGTIRESRSSSCNRAETGQSCTAHTCVGRKAHRGDHARPKLSRHSTSLKRDAGKFFCVFFSGKGGVARCARKLGFETREWELLHGSNGDLTSPAVLFKIKTDIRNGKVLAAMLAPPCSSFSPARDRTMVIRTRECPWGLPNLPSHEQRKVEIGNLCFLSALKIIGWLDEAGVPWVLENPHGSKCWHLAQLQVLSQSLHTQIVVVDFCQYQTSWRKRTRLLCGNIATEDLDRMRLRRCTGTRGYCSRTQRKHFQLSGSNKKGIPWTRVAQPYPPRLCHDLSHALLAHRFVVHHG